MAGSTKHPEIIATPVHDPGLLERAGWTNAEVNLGADPGGCRGMRAGRTAIPKRRSCGAAPWNWAREHLPPGDLRVATSVANLAVAERRAGDAPAAQRMIEEALALWDAGDRWIESLKPITFARQLHVPFALAGQAPGRLRPPSEGTIPGAGDGRTIESSPRGATASPDARDRLERWRRERPDGFDDRRKLLGAVLLIAPDGGT